MTEIPVPAETLRRLVESSIGNARIQRAKGRNYNARAIQRSASNILRAVDLADGEFVSVEETDLRNLTAFSFETEGDASDIRDTVNTFVENQHTYNPPE